MAALLATIFISFAIIGRVAIAYFTTGNHGIRLANARTEPVAAVAGGAFSLAFAVALIIVGLDFSHVWSVQRIDLAYFNELGFAVGVMGVALVVVAQLQMGSAWRIGVDQSEKTTLVTSGLYRRSRNPIYFGLALFWVSLSVLLPHPSVWVLAALCWISIEFIVRKVEEPYLLRLHGSEFEVYMKHTNRYLIW